MTELSREAAALLEAARRSHGPSEPDRERVLSALHASLGIAVPLALASSVAEAASEALGASAAEAASAAQATGSAQGAAQLSGKGAWSYGSKLLTWKAGKIFLATVALGSAVGVASLPSRRVESDRVELRSGQANARPAESARALGTGNAASPPVVAPVPVATVASADATELQQHHDVDLHRVLPDAAQGAVRATSARHRGEDRTRSHRVRSRAMALRSASAASAAPAVVDEPTTPEAQLAAAPTPAVVHEAPPAELELIRKAMTSLRDRDATGALALLDEHASRYPHGAFASERGGLHVLALCAAGRLSEGRVEQLSFLREHGETPIAARVRRACAEPKR
ncbi:MAG: hypothetical protein JWN04_567 [Myxococcaceae bacterium]|nr:hypothetical protein [Myxococcaceae bacterium]